MSGRRPSEPRTVRLSMKLYRTGLWLYPSGFRRAFGAEIADSFHDLARAAWRHRGPAGVLRLWPSALVDLLRGGLAERLAALRDPRRRSPGIPGGEIAYLRRQHAMLRLRSRSPRPRSDAMNDLIQDLRFAVRQLRRAPGFTAAVAATIALGVGASTAIFTVVNGIVLRPLPFPDSERVVVLCETHPRVQDYCVGSPPQIEDFGRLSDSLAEVGVARTFSYALADDRGRASITAGIASPGFLRVFGARADVGRLLEDGDMPEGDNRVVVLTHGFWQSRFGGDPDIVGRSVTMSEEPWTVVGVLSEDSWIEGYGWVSAWVPLTATPEQTDTRDWRGFSAVGMLAEGVRLERVREELEGVRVALEQEYPEDNVGWGLRVESMRERVAGRAAPTLMVFVAAVACVLLIGCANVANLLLVRATNRSAEFALRAAVGAGRGRLVRQVLTESVLLALMGGGLGFVLAVLATDGFLTLAPTDIPRLDEVGIDLRALLFTGALALGTALLFGLAPALRAARTDLNDSLRSARHGGSASRGLRNALVVGQMAMALVLLIVAGLLGRSFTALLAWDPGFERGGLVTAWSVVNFGRFDSGEEMTAAFEGVADAIRAIPGVTAVGQSSAGPLFGGIETSTISIEGRPPLPPDEQPTARWYDIDPEYFATMGIPMVRGRGFAETDDAGSVPVTIVNQTFVQRHFPDSDPIGERVTVGDRSLQIVGVVADVRPFRPDEPAAAEIYYPRRQFPRGGTYYVVRTGIGLASLEQQVQEKVEREFPDVSVSGFRTLEDRTAQQLVSPRFNLALVGLFAAVALTLAAVGVYGVISYSVATRTHEIGVRVALGARPAAISRSIVGTALGLAGVGLAIGIGVALVSGRLIASQLYGVSSRDLPTYAFVTVIILAVAALAAAIPARRAARLDPVRALRNE